MCPQAQCEQAIEDAERARAAEEAKCTQLRAERSADAARYAAACAEWATARGEAERAAAQLRAELVEVRAVDKHTHPHPKCATGVRTGGDADQKVPDACLAGVHVVAARRARDPRGCVRARRVRAGNLPAIWVAVHAAS
jgi:hypothetical protein